MAVKSDRAIRIAKGVVAAIFLTLVILAFKGGHLLPQTAVRLQAGPAILAHPFLAGSAFLVLTLLFGRFFCEMMCPLGILQSLANWLARRGKGVRRVCTRLPETTAQRIVRYSVAAVFVLLIVFGWGALAYAVEPYSIVGRALTGLLPFVLLLTAIVLLAAFSDGRIWCNWVCPLGTLFTFLGRHARFGNRIGHNCARCGKCFPKQPAAPTPAAESPAEAGGVTRRAAVQGLALLAVAEKTTDGGLAELVAPGRIARRRHSVLPPGAGSRGRFSRACLACGLCMSACPTKVIVPSVACKTFGQPELDFSRGSCDMNCDLQCAQRCPAGALRPLDDVPRKDIHIGRAVWRSDRCLRTTDGVPCSVCVRSCPVDALRIHTDENDPTKTAIAVRENLCTGCGRCEYSCAARPLPAIVIEGEDVQRVVRPMREHDLIDEMRDVLDKGAAVVVAHEGIIDAQESGRGIAPLLKLHDDGRLRGALVVDRVIGRAAAAICISGGVRKVHALVMSIDAEMLLRGHGVLCQCDKTVERIMRRDGEAPCPMEETVSALTDPAAMVEALRTKIRAK